MFQNFYRQRLREGLEEFFYSVSDATDMDLAPTWTPRGKDVEQITLLQNFDYRLHGFSLPDNPRFVTFQGTATTRTEVIGYINTLERLRRVYWRNYFWSMSDVSWAIVGLFTGAVVLLWDSADLGWFGVVAVIIALVITFLGAAELLERWLALQELNRRMRRINKELNSALGVFQSVQVSEGVKISYPGEAAA